MISPRQPGRLFATALAVTLTALLTPVSAASAVPATEVTIPDAVDAVADSYIVVLHGDAAGQELGARAKAEVSGAAQRLGARYGGQVGHVYHNALTGFEIRLPEPAARRLAADPAVASVERNRIVHLGPAPAQVNLPPWGLDRINQRYLPLDGNTELPNSGAGVRVYVIDTGIRITHNDFGGRAVYGYDAIDNDYVADDCNGHGTHLAGTVGGRTYGVAKQATLVAVRVLNCSGSGTMAQVIAGVDWVTADHQAGRPAVALMGLGGSANTALDTEVQSSIKDGVTYAVTAGNSNASACNYSPARVVPALTVAATTITDARASSGNHGECVDVYAPGVNITSAGHTSDTASVTISSSSAAAAHVAGCVAVFLAANPSWPPAQVAPHLSSHATPNVVSGVPPGTPNRLLYCG